jgi:hypothetical protein
MTTRLIKLVCATALAVPVVGFVGTGSAHAWDCSQPYGAVTSNPNCERAGGIPFRFHRHHHHHHNWNNGPWGGGPEALR